MQTAIFTEGYPHDSAFLSHFLQTVCFSGHRPDAFPDAPICGILPEDLLKTMLAGCIEAAIQDGFRYFINGLAEGVDLWAADYLVFRQTETPDTVHLIAAEPCLDYLKNRRRGKEAMMQYVAHCDALLTIPRKGKDSFLRRNDYMLEHSARLICFIRKNTGGTAYTLQAAQKKNREIHCMDFRLQDLLLRFACYLLENDHMIPQTAAERYAYYQTYPEAIGDCRSLLTISGSL